MPIIPPPVDRVYEEVDYTPRLPDHELQARNERIREFFNCVNWKCPECGTVNFGRNKACAYCKIRLRKHTPKPQE